MKPTFITTVFCLFIVVVTIVACTKTTDPSNNPNPSASYKVKTIHYQKDSGGIPETPNDIYTSQNVDSFIYDANNRLIVRYYLQVQGRPLYNTVTIDTTNKFVYTYASNNSNLITSYTERCYATTGTIKIWNLNHVLKYDVNDRIVLDSVTNPLGYNNKVTTFNYAGNMVIEHNDGWYSIDTLTFNGNDLLNEKMENDSTYIKFTSSVYVSPFTYINNYKLWKSDYQNGLGSFLIFYPYTRSYFMPSYVSTNSNGYIENFFINPVVDSLGRVVSSTTVFGSSRKITTYEYY